MLDGSQHLGASITTISYVLQALRWLPLWYLQIIKPLHAALRSSVFSEMPLISAENSTKHADCRPLGARSIPFRLRLVVFTGRFGKER